MAKRARVFCLDGHIGTGLTRGCRGRRWRRLGQRRDSAKWAKYCSGAFLGVLSQMVRIPGGFGLVCRQPAALASVNYWDTGEAFA